MPRRKALLIGINYFGTNHQLNGCINDAMNMRQYLAQDRGFSANHHDMVIMTDAPENRGTPFEPTGANMMAVSALSSPVCDISVKTSSSNRHSSGWSLATTLAIRFSCPILVTEVPLFNRDHLKIS